MYRKNKMKYFAAAMSLVLAISVLQTGNMDVVQAESGSSATGRDLLAMTLDYCETMDESKYTAESWEAFQTELTEAKASYEANELDSDGFYELRDELEDAKTDLVFMQTEDAGNPLPFRELSVDEIVAEMGTGWNLGNTMDGHTGFTPSETLWQSVETTKELIKSVHDLGFNTVRIPVTWGTMIDDSDYSIDEAWISRVQDIVDYCISQDMYAIINIHHDGAEQTGWLRVAADDIDAVYEKFEGVWRTIANRFKDYDEHLIFEAMNEVAGDETTTIKHDTRVIMNLNQIFTNVVRATGSNNAKRFLSVTGRYTNIENTTAAVNEFKMPTDTVENRIFVAVHYYDFQFGMAENMNGLKWDYDSAQALQKEFDKLVTHLTSQGIPVILGEYGAINKNNPTTRAYHLEVVNRLCAQDGVVPVYWDQGWYDRSAEPADYSYTLVDRNTGETIDSVVTDAVIRGFFIEGAADLSDITDGTEVTQITDVTLSTDQLGLTIGESAKITAEVLPANSNDVLLWKTEDETIATVYNGQVRARGIGVTTLYAYSQSGSVEKTVEVTVRALAASGDMAEIQSAAGQKIVLEEGGHFYLNAALQSSVEGDYLYYQSSNEAIATVSATGKVVAKSVGNTYIIITAASGVTSVIPVSVTEASRENEIRLALNVYYNDEDASYFSNEVGEPITVTGEGQYEVTFDCALDLSEKAAAAGVTGLHNMTAVYIKDQTVTEGGAKVSPLASCNIMYDSVVVDGKALTVIQTEPKSALKASGVFDTNDPLNSWDGSQVEEVTVKQHVLNITDMENPQKITVTFTLSDVVFTEGTGASAEGKQVNAVTTPESVTLTEDTAKQELEFSVDGEDGALLTAVPQSAAVAAIDTTAVAVQDGKIVLPIAALAEGDTTVTIYAESGEMATFQLVSETSGESVTDPAPVEETIEEDLAEEPAVEDTTSETSEPESEDGGINWLLIILIAVVAAVAAGFVGYLIASKAGSKKEK